MAILPENIRRYSSLEANDDDDEKPKKRGRNISQMGSVVAHSSSIEKKSEEKGSDKKKQAEQAKKEEKTPEDDVPESETTEISKDELKHATLKDNLAVEIANLEDQAETAQPGTAEKIQAEAALELVKAVDQKVDNPEMEFDPAVEAEYRTRMAELADEDSEDEAEYLEIPEFESSGEVDEAEEPVEEDVPTMAAAAPPTPPIQPPLPPLPSRGATPSNSSGSRPGSPPPPSSGMYGPGGGPIAPAIELRPAATETSVETAMPSRRSNKTGAFLLGYMFGRRGGRKRTEAKLQPKIDTLEKEVEKSEQNLAVRTEQVKRATSEKYDREAYEKITARREFNERTRAANERNSASRTPVSEILKQTVSAPEQISSSPTTRDAEQIKRVPEATVKRTEQLSTPDLLKAAEEIFISGTSVRTLYEANQIDRSGLIEIVQTAMRGGSVSEAYENVELGLERQRERAREFRHDPGFGVSSIDDITDLKAKTEPVPLSVQALPNTPNTESLQPLSSSKPPLNISHVNDELEPIDLDSIPQPKTAQFAVAAIVAIGLAIIVIGLLFSL